MFIIISDVLCIQTKNMHRSLPRDCPPCKTQDGFSKLMEDTVRIFTHLRTYTHTQNNFFYKNVLFPKPFVFLLLFLFVLYIFVR